MRKFIFGAHIQGSFGSSTGDVYAYDIESIRGEEISLSEYAGKVILIVNTASRCVFTSQYKKLESLYQKYNEKGLVILGFPSNDFLNQEPGSDSEIQRFCEINYSITFPLMKKGSVRGDTKQALFRFLTEESHDVLKGELRWNFEKFLIGGDGVPRSRYPSWVSPTNKHFIKKLEELLSELTF